MYFKGANNGIFFFLLNQQNKIKRKVNKRKIIIKPTLEKNKPKKYGWKWFTNYMPSKRWIFVLWGLIAHNVVFKLIYLKNVAQAENHIAVAEGQQQQQQIVCSVMCAYHLFITRCVNNKFVFWKNNNMQQAEREK